MELNRSAMDSTASATSAWEWPRLPAANFPAAMKILTTIPSSVARSPRFRRLIDIRFGALNHVAKHGVSELWLEPGAFGRHDAAGVRDGHQVLDARGEHRERAGVIALVDELF